MFNATVPYYYPSLFPVKYKKFIYPYLKLHCQTKGQRKSWIIFIILYGIYRLSGHTAFFCQLFLGNPQPFPDFSDSVFHIIHRAFS